MKRPSAVDLFSGAGGLSLGLSRAGFDVKAGVDAWGPAIRSYRHNFSHPAIEADVASLSAQDLAFSTGVPVGELDLLAGGPPCQGFSIQRIGSDEDDRNDLVLQFVRLVEAYQPRAFLMENVLGLLGKRGSEVMRRLNQRTVRAGYSIVITRIDSADFGVPQHRRRVVVYGWRADTQPLHPAVSREPVVTVREALADLPRPATPGSRVAEDPLHIESRLSDLNRLRLRHIPPGGGFEDLPIELRVNCHKNGASAIGHRSVYGRLHPDKPAGVITARFDSFTRGRFAHPFEDRNVTLREGARLQTFPDDFEFVGTREEIAAQIGNAIPPRVAQALGAALLPQLMGGGQSRDPHRLERLA